MDPVLDCHFHVVSLFKSWSKLGLTGVQNEHIKFKKNQKHGKPAHTFFLCDTLMTKVDKQDLHTFEQKNHVSNVVTLNIEL